MLCCMHCAKVGDAFAISPSDMMGSESSLRSVSEVSSMHFRLL